MRLDNERRSGARLLVFVAMTLAFVGLSLWPPVREWFQVDTVARVAARLGVFGPALILACGALTPLLMLPRWPIAFVSGLLYGVFAGAALATAASTVGAAIHFGVARGLVAPSADRLLARLGWMRKSLTREKLFILIFCLRAFPLSNFTATNLLAAALSMPLRPYLLASFLGMIPSSILYAAWGKIMKKPSPSFHAALALSLLFIVGGTLVAPAILRRLKASANPAPPHEPT